MPAYKWPLYLDAGICRGDGAPQVEEEQAEVKARKLDSASGELDTLTMALGEQREALQDALDEQ